MPRVEGAPELMKAFTKMEVHGPIHMLNLLRFKEDGGRESYAEYSARTLPLVEKRGGKVVYRAQARMTIIGAEEWDDMFIVEYPSKDAFLDMVLSDEYQQGAHLRHEALVDSRLVCLQTQ